MGAKEEGTGFNLHPDREPSLVHSSEIAIACERPAAGDPRQLRAPRGPQIPVEML